MNAYENLAASYDRLTNDVDYEATVDFYWQILAREGLSPRTAVDLACGTGSVALLLAKKGLQVIGVDLSEDMLCQANQKAQEQDLQVMFLQQPLQRLRLARGVDLAVCALDSMDYITNPEDCREAIARVYRVLNPGGCFIFDVKMTMYIASGVANLKKRPMCALTLWICSSAGEMCGYVVLKSTGSMLTLPSS